MPEALLVIDYQNDFARPDGALSVPEGEVIADRINEMARSERFDLVVATRDWHPREHSSFERLGGVWPDHCVQGTPGAELHPALELDNVDVVVEKGQDPDTPGYSAFERPEFLALLHDRGVDSLTLTGLATEYCVKSTALDARRAGFDVAVETDAIRAVDPEDSERALAEMREAGVEFR